MILFTFSPTTVAYIKPQRICKSSTLDELLGPVHCLKGVFEKATEPPQRETISRYRKALCTTVLGLFSHLKIPGIFILTAHIGSNRYVKIDWQKSLLPAFRLFTLTWSTNSLFSLLSQTSTGFVGIYCMCKLTVIPNCMCKLMVMVYCFIWLSQ